LQQLELNRQLHDIRSGGSSSSASSTAAAGGACLLMEAALHRLCELWLHDKQQQQQQQQLHGQQRLHTTAPGAWTAA
jgi:hypothetical protein